MNPGNRPATRPQAGIWRRLWHSRNRTPDSAINLAASPNENLISVPAGKNLASENAFFDSLAGRNKRWTQCADFCTAAYRLEVCDDNCDIDGIQKPGVRHA